MQHSNRNISSHSSARLQRRTSVSPAAGAGWRAVAEVRSAPRAELQIDWNDDFQDFLMEVGCGDKGFSKIACAI